MVASMSDENEKTTVSKSTRVMQIVLAVIFFAVFLLGVFSFVPVETSGSSEGGSSAPIRAEESPF